MRRIIIVLLCALFLASAIPGKGYADWLWDQHQRADALEQAGRIEEALPLWLQLAEGYARRSDWTNAALYWKKRGRALEEFGRRAEAIAAYENEAYFWAKAGHADWGQEDLIRTDSLRSTVRLFVSRPAEGGVNQALAKFEPASGAYLGVYSERDPAVGSWPDKAAGAYGRPHAAFLIYTPYRFVYEDTHTYFPAEWARRAREAGAALQVHLMPHKGLDDVKDDAYLRTFAREAKAADIPIFLRFGGEMNGDWVAWHGNPAKFIEAWRIVTKVMREEAPNVAMVWAPNHVPALTIDQYYPGDEWVDWVGISLYQDYFASGLAEFPAERESPLDKIRDIYDRYAGRKPIMIAEWGAANREYTNNRDVTEWGAAQVERLYRSLPMLYPRVKAVFYFSVDQKRDPNPFHPTAIWSSYLLTDKQRVNTAYREATAGPYYHERVAPAGELAGPVRYEELTDFAAVRAGQEELSAYVKVYDPFISKVEYRLEGAAPVVRTSFPYTVAYDFALYAGRTVNLEVLAYNSQGQVEGKRLIRLVVGEAGAGSAPADMHGHWAQELVSRMVSYGIVSGYPDGTFQPDQPISREAFVKLVAVALGLEEAPGGAPSFVDVQADRWSFPYVEAATAAGLLVPGEYPGERLDPGGAISRSEMAVIVVRALGLWKEAEFEERAVPFTDAGSIPEQRRGYAALAAERGLIGGMPDGRFAGGESATRAQAAVVIARLLAALEQ